MIISQKWDIFTKMCNFHNNSLLGFADWIGHFWSGIMAIEGGNSKKAYQEKGLLQKGLLQKGLPQKGVSKMAYKITSTCVHLVFENF